MKKLLIPIMIVLALTSIAGTKMKAFVDYDKNADFGSYKTFKWVDTEATSVDDSSPSMHRLIRALIMKRLVEGGLKKVDDNPDLNVTYHTNEHDVLRMNTTQYRYHYSAGWWVSPYWGSGMDITSYSQGTLIIDIWDPKTEEIIWRGAVVGVVPEHPEQAEKQITKALNLLGKKWRKMYRAGK